MLTNVLRIQITRFATAIAFVAATLVLFSLLAPWLPPADSVAHFRHYLLGGLAALAVVHVIVRKHHVAAISGVVVVAGAISMPQLFVPEGTSASANFEVVQANLRYDNADVRGLDSAIADADLLTLQEVSDYNESSVSRMTAAFASRQRCPLTDFMDVLVLSRHASSAGGCAEGLAWMTLPIDGRSVTVVSIHLYWPWPFSQREQLDRLGSTIRELPQPVILAGDFNAAPWSATISDVSRWSDTKIAPGIRNSFALKLPYLGIGLDLPIDHILVAEDFQFVSIDVLDPIGSDHKAIRAEISIPKLPRHDD